MSRFQYATSTDPDVIAAVGANQQAHAEFREAAKAFVSERGFERFFGSSFGGRYQIDALPGKPDEARFGKYKANGAPYKSNTAERQAMASCSRRTVPVPGLDVFITDLPDGRCLMSEPTPFLHDGAAWVMLSQMPHRGDFGPQWTEVKASEAHAAREAVEGKA